MRNVVGIVLILLFISVALFWVLQKSNPQQPRSSTPPVDASETLGSSGFDSSEAATPMRQLSDPSKPHEDGWISGIVQCDVTHRPIKASVSSDDHRSVWSDAKTGRFTLHGLPIPGRLTLSANGFRPKHVVVPSSSRGVHLLDVEVITLHPEFLVSVAVVHSDGRPGAGAEVIVHFPDSPSYSTRADSDGLSSLSLSTSGTLFAFLGQDVSKILRVSPDHSRVTLRLESSPRIEVVDGNGEGIERLRLCALSMNGEEGFNLVLTTDEHGINEQPIPQGRYLIQSLAPHITLVNERLPIFANREDNSVPTDLTEGGLVRILGLVDELADTEFFFHDGNDLEGLTPITLWVLQPLGNGVLGQVVWRNRETLDGHIRVDKRLMDVLEADHDHRISIMAWTPHAMGRIMSSRDLIGQREIPVALYKNASSWSLTLEGSTGSSTLPAVSVYETFEGFAGFHPLLEPTPERPNTFTSENWKGGDVVVAWPSGKRVIPAEALIASPLHRIDVDKGTSEIVVVSVPLNSAPELIAMIATHRGHTRIEGQQDGDRVIFGPVHSGTYDVFPSSFANEFPILFEHPGKVSQRVTVAESQRQEILFKPEWSQSLANSGMVEIMGEPLRDPLFVSPVFAPETVPITPRTLRHYPVEPDGSFSIPRDPCQARCYLAFIVDEFGQHIPLAYSLTPRIRIANTSLDIRFSGPAPEGDAFVLFKGAINGVNLQRSLVYRKVTAGSITCPSVPEKLNSFTVAWPLGQRDFVEFKMVPGVLNTVTLNID